MSDLAKEPIEKLLQFVHLLMPNTPMHTAIMQEIERRNKQRMLKRKIIKRSLPILFAVTLIIIWLTHVKLWE